MPKQPSGKSGPPACIAFRCDAPSAGRSRQARPIRPASPGRAELTGVRAARSSYWSRGAFGSAAPADAGACGASRPRASSLRRPFPRPPVTAERSLPYAVVHPHGKQGAVGGKERNQRRRIRLREVLLRSGPRRTSRQLIKTLRRGERRVGGIDNLATRVAGPPNRHANWATRNMRRQPNRRAKWQ
jgi:hypothetical protein